MIPKGELLDPVHGEYSGANEAVQKKSLGGVKQIYLHSMFGHPHTSCGCFESIAFYIPEVDGIGAVSPQARIRRRMSFIPEPLISMRKSPAISREPASRSRLWRVF